MFKYSYKVIENTLHIHMYSMYICTVCKVYSMNSLQILRILHHGLYSAISFICMYKKEIINLITRVCTYV